MRLRIQNTPILSTALKFLGVLILLSVLSHSGNAQNTKGDRPSGSRESRFKTSPRKSKDGGQGYTPRSRARGGERAGKPLKPVFNVHKPREQQKAWKGDLTGRRLQHRNSSSDKFKPKVYRQTGPNVKRRVPDREGRQNVARGRPPKIPSATGTIKNVYRQKGPFVSNPHSKPRREPKAVSNRTALARVKKLQTGDKLETGGGGRIRVTPRSASRPFIRNKSINVWANFKRPKKKPVKAQTTDIAGRKIRGRNYQTPGPGLIKAPNTYRGRVTGKDRPYSGPGGYNRTATKPSRAWTGDIAGRAIRHRNKSSKKSVEGRPFLWSKSRSGSGKGNVFNRPLPVKKPGYGAMGLGSAGRRKMQGGRRVNTSGIAVRSKGGVGFNNQGTGFAGWKRGDRRRVNSSGIPVRAKGGVGFNNQGEEFASQKSRKKSRVNVSGIPVRSERPGRFGDQGEGFSGGLRAKRPLKGGGSVSGRVWNNRGRALPPKIPGNRDLTNLPGNFKARRPPKGGGSVSGQLWNNKGQALPPRVPRQRDFTNLPGNYKARRPEKGGGSVSGKLWNNDEKPLPRKPFRGADVAGFSGNLKAKPKGPTAEQKRVGHYRGSSKLAEVMPLNVDQGEEFTGYQKLPKWRKAYIQNKLAHEESLKKKRPEKEAFGVEGLQVKVQRRDYVRNKDISESALKKLKPTATDKAVSGVYARVRQYKYVRNPSSAEGALKVREPGKAFARATDYQGNIKMQKYQLFEKNRQLHPDAQFVKTNKNNVQGERDTLTNLKLWWARLFKKQENQPEHLKEKLKKPRYDNGEQGMWYD